MSPEDEGDRARKLGLKYLHFPVDKEEMNAAQVDEFRERLEHFLN